MKRFLITTALEKTWPTNNEPVLFLGEWCRLYRRKATWEKLDGVVATYHWDNREKLYKDYLYLRNLYEELLIELVERLNVIHSVNFSLRYWRIIIGPWLGYFIQMVFDRWEMLQQVVKSDNLSGVRVMHREKEDLIPNDMADFSALYTGDDWNELIYSQIMAWMKIPAETVHSPNMVHASPGKEVSINPIKRLKRFLGVVYHHISSLFYRDCDFFFISTYLKRNQEICLQAILGQIPVFWPPYLAGPTAPVNLEKRQWELTAPKTEVGDCNFSLFIRAMIPKHIPIAYLEGYKNMVTFTNSLLWPKNPKAIFTANAYNSFDVFKVWAAEKIEYGCPLIIGQHGGGHGANKWGFYEEHQFAISDRWISWGFEDEGTSKIRSFGNLKMLGVVWQLKPDGGALMVEMGLPRYSYHMYSIPVASQWLEYLEDQYLFVAALPLVLQRQLTVRLSPHDYEWGQLERWRDKFPTIQIDEGTTYIEKSIEKSRIFIATYNATTFLESMAMNMPTIMFWNPRHSELNESAIIHYNKLKAVGILHDNPESAANQMIRVWNTIPEWWDSESVKHVRREFCERYSKIPQNPIKDLNHIFREVIQ